MKCSLACVLCELWGKLEPRPWHTGRPLTGMSLSVLNPCQPRAAQIQWRQLRDTEPNTSSPLAPLLRDGKHRSGSAILSDTSFSFFCDLTQSFSLPNTLSARDYCKHVREFERGTGFGWEMVRGGGGGEERDVWKRRAPFRRDAGRSARAQATIPSLWRKRRCHGNCIYR